MTVIAGVVDGDRVWMASDSMSTDDEYDARTQNHMVHPKIFVVGDALVGLAGQHIQHTIMRFYNPPKPLPNQETVHWVQKKLMPWLDKRLDDLKPQKRRCNMLVARGGVLLLAEMNQRDVVPLDVAAIGHGASYALGALTALGEVSIIGGRDRATSAIRAACLHDPYCGGRIDVASTKGLSVAEGKGMVP